MSLPAGRTQRASLGVVLFAGVLSPVMAEAFRWATTLDQEPSDAGWRGDSTIYVSDTLANGAAWLLVLFWGLVALGHRHVASGWLLLAGALLGGRCLALLPGVLATAVGRGTARP